MEDDEYDDFNMNGMSGGGAGGAGRAGGAGSKADADARELEDMLDREIGDDGAGGGSGAHGGRGASASGVSKAGLATDVIELQQAWVHEKAAPELLGFQMALVTTLGAQVAAQTAALEKMYNPPAPRGEDAGKPRPVEESMHKLALLQVSGGRAGLQAAALMRRW
jgi:hypothetical protein